MAQALREVVRNIFREKLAAGRVVSKLVAEYVKLGARIVATGTDVGMMMEVGAERAKKASPPSGVVLPSLGEKPANEFAARATSRDLPYGKKTPRSSRGEAKRLLRSGGWNKVFGN